MKLEDILKQRGIMSLEDLDYLMQNQQFISTGYQEIDDIIGPNGGFPRGCLSEIYGFSRSGKSRFVRDICLRPELNALYIDTENALCADEYNYMREHGVTVVAEQLLENIWGLVNDVLDNELFDVIVVDSLGNTDTQAERDDDNTLSMSTNVQRAKIMSKWLRGLNHHIKGNKAALIFVNHGKKGIGLYPQMEKPCGKAVDFQCMVQLKITGADSRISGTKKPTEVTVVKTRYGIVGKKVKISLDLDPYKEIKSFPEEANYVSPIKTKKKGKK